MPCQLDEEVVSRAATLANEVEQLHINNTGLLNNIIERIEVHKKSVLITLVLVKLQQQLRISVVDKEASPDGVTKVIEVPGHILRCGKEVRLIIGNDQAPVHRLTNVSFGKSHKRGSGLQISQEARQQRLLISLGSTRSMPLMSAGGSHWPSSHPTSPS
jgi:hypothetical protein